MSMTPQEKRDFDEMKATLQSLVRVENVPFIENIKRRLDVEATVNNAVGALTLNDLGDVDVPAPTNGQVLKYTTTGVDRWIAGADNV